VTVSRIAGGLCWLAAAIVLFGVAAAASHNHFLDLILGAVVFVIVTGALIMKGPSEHERAGKDWDPQLWSLLVGLGLFVVGSIVLGVLAEAVTRHSSWSIDGGWAVIAIASGFAGSIGAGLAFTALSGSSRHTRLQEHDL
jgi:drug/metabolite transporter (DMT)-like permease